MKNFRTLEQAKKDLAVIQEYVDLIENYQPKSLTQHVISVYSRCGNIARTASYLNEQGFRIDGRLIEPADVSEMIRSKPAKDDLLHKKVRELYLKRIKPYAFHMLKGRRGKAAR